MLTSVLLILLVVFLPVADVQAQACGQSCTNPPSCSALGYKKNITCLEGYITCPFDSSYKWCKEYTCEDGRYYSALLKSSDGYTCDAVKYHGLSCYDCYIEGCQSGQYNKATCWSGKLWALATDVTYCSQLGYIDSKDDCSNYMACPADTSQVKCIPES